MSLENWIKGDRMQPDFVTSEQMAAKAKDVQSVMAAMCSKQKQEIDRRTKDFFAGPKAIDKAIAKLLDDNPELIDEFLDNLDDAILELSE